MPVPLLDVNAQNLPLEAELKRAFETVLRSGRFILGEEVEAFERECAAATGAKHALSISSGTDALLAVLMALGIGPDDEVLCPSFTFFATAGSISRTGAVPRFCDVREDDFNIDLDSAARLVNPRTRAIMPVHLFGQCCDMDAIRAFAEKHCLAVIEDCAQSIGATFAGVPCGNFGASGCFSFFPSKNLGGFGDGGLVTTSDDALAEKIVRLRNHGMHPRYHHRIVGGNFRMDALQCALLRVKLRRLDDYAAGRARNAAWYSANLPLPDGCSLPAALPGRGHVWNQFTLRIPGEGRRDALRQHLSARGIGCEIYYPVPLHLQECFAHLPAADCPVSETLAREALSIPVYPELTPAQLEEVAEAFASFAR